MLTFSKHYQKIKQNYDIVKTQQSDRSVTTSTFEVMPVILQKKYIFPWICIHLPGQQLNELLSGPHNV